MGYPINTGKRAEEERSRVHKMTGYADGGGVKKRKSDGDTNIHIEVNGKPKDEAGGPGAGLGAALASAAAQRAAPPPMPMPPMGGPGGPPPMGMGPGGPGTGPGPIAMKRGGGVKKTVSKRFDKAPAGKKKSGPPLTLAAPPPSTKSKTQLPINDLISPPVGRPPLRMRGFGAGAPPTPDGAPADQPTPMIKRGGHVKKKAFGGGLSGPSPMMPGASPGMVPGAAPGMMRPGMKRGGSALSTAAKVTTRKAQGGGVTNSGPHAGGAGGGEGRIAKMLDGKKR